MRKLLALFLILIIGCSPDENTFKYNPVDWNSTAPPIPPKIETPPPKSEFPPFVEKLLLLHNEQRELKGRVGFVLDPYLIKYAQNHAEWMAQKNRMKHSDISVLIGTYSTAGENIAWNQSDEKEVVVAWMNSSGHRANILNRSFTKVGFGLAYNSNNEPYWCTVFGN